MGKQRGFMWAAAVLFSLLASCGGSPARPTIRSVSGAVQPPEPVAKPTCEAPKTPGTFTFCEPDGESDPYVVGLPRGNGWRRKDLVELRLPLGGGATPEVVQAMAWVVQEGDDFVQVHVLHQRVTVLDGATARLVKPNERARMDYIVARVVEAQGAKLRIDVGKLDKAKEGSLYDLLSAETLLPVGRLRLTELGEFEAWGEPVGVVGPVPVGSVAVYARDADTETAPTYSIVVVNFDSEIPGPAGAEVGAGFAKMFAHDLNNAAKGSPIKAFYAESDRVDLGKGEPEAHKQARVIGKRFKADVVVWGSARCDKKACLKPRFTVVEPAALQGNEIAGRDVWLASDGAGFNFAGAGPTDPLVLAQAILGNATYDAQRYEDAKSYLGLALSKGVLQGTDELQALMRVSYALYVRGQTVAARQQANLLVKRARTLKEPRWEQLGRAELARLDILQGKVADARAHLQAIRVWSEANNDAGMLSYALGTLGDLEAQQGRVDEARRLYQASLDKERSIGDVKGEAATLHRLAILEAQQGRVDEARRLYQASLDKTRSIGDVQGEAATLHQLAGLEAQQGRVDEARSLYQASLDKERSIGDVKGEATTLHQLAILEAQQGRVDEARRLYQASLDKRRSIGDVAGEAATLHQLAGLEAQEGRVDEARALYQASLDKNRSIGNVQGELSTTIRLAELDYQHGKVELARASLLQALETARALQSVESEANTLWHLGNVYVRLNDLGAARQAWLDARVLYIQLKMAPDIEDIDARLGSLSVFEQLAAARKAHPGLLAGGGVLVTRVVPDGQAAKAGFAPGDILVRYGSTRLDKSTTLQTVAKATDAKTLVTIEVLRGAKAITLQVHGGLLGVVIEDVAPVSPSP